MHACVRASRDMHAYLVPVLGDLGQPKRAAEVDEVEDVFLEARACHIREGARAIVGREGASWKHEPAILGREGASWKHEPARAIVGREGVS